MTHRSGVRPAVSWLLIVFLAGLLAACTNSPMAWKILYGQFDNLLVKEFLSYADFNESQESQIRKEVDNTIRWHRQHELPRYADTIAEFQQRVLIESAEPTDINWLFDTLSDAGRRFNARSPLLSLIPVLASLDEAQTAQIAAHIEEEFEESKKEREKEGDRDTAERVAEGLQKVLIRLGLRLNRNQRTRVIEQLQRRQMTGEIQEAIWRQWSDQLLEILEQRTADDFAERFSRHYFARLSVMEISVPEIWQHDTQLFRNLFLELFQSLDAEQIESMHKGLNRVKEVILELSEGNST